MLRSIAWLVLGALVGGALVLARLESVDESAVPGTDSSSLRERISGLVGGGDEPMVQAVTVSETVAAYREAASVPDRASLRDALERIPAEPWSPARDVEIDAILLRLADIDPAYAAETTLALGLDTYLVADAYLNWASIDPAAAIGALGAIGSRAERIDVALALLDALGDDASGLERVAEGLSEQEASLLIVEAIVARAEREPFVAFRDAMALREADLRGQALSGVGAVWAAQDPRGAIAQAGQLPVELRGSFRSGVFSEWARLDGADFAAWILSVSPPPAEAVVGIDFLDGAHLEQLIGVAGSVPGESGRMMLMAAFSALAERDAAAAMARAAAFRPGSDRDAILASVAATVAREDPAAAFEWARGITPPSRNLMSQITIAMVQADPASAVRFLERPPEGVDPQLVAMVLGSSIGRDPDAAEVMAGALAASDSIQAANALARVVGSWMQQDPERAFEWVLANDDALDAGIIVPAAEALARADPVAAAGYIDRIPDEYLSAWIMRVAGPYGLRDPSAALAWVARFQGRDFYDGALQQVIAASAQSDARAAARALSQSSAEVQLGAAAQVAQALARQDPREAARWATTLTEPRARQGAISSSVRAWAVADPGGARSFTLGLDRGETRDQALSALLMSLGQAGRFDTDLLDSYSSDSAAQNTLTVVIPLIAQTDPAEARDLVSLVTSGDSRRLIEERIRAVE